MTAELSLVSAFLVGLFGSVHCIGMCGGIVGTLTAGTINQKQGKQTDLLPYHLLYNLGRITSYAIAGFIFGYIGKQTGQLAISEHLTIAPYLVGIFMIILGGYISGWWRILTIVESWGSHLWKRIQPLGNKFLPIKNPVHALLLGTVWGWLPCGLVYSTLAWSLATTDPLQGAMIMVAFGLGTTPMLLSLGLIGELLLKYSQKQSIRIIAGASITLFGVITILLG